MPQLHGAAAARRRVVHRRRQPLRRGHHLRDRPRRERRPGGTRHLQRSRVRAPGDRLCLQPWHHRDRLGGRRGGRTPQPARRPSPHDRGQRDRRPRGPERRARHEQAAQLPAARRVHELRHAHRPLGRGQLVLVGGHRQELGRDRPHLQRRAQRVRCGPVRLVRPIRETQTVERLHARERRTVRDHAERGAAAARVGRHSRHPRQRLLATRQQSAERGQNLSRRRRRWAGR